MPKYETSYELSAMPKDLETVIYEKKDHIAYVTMNRPDARNAMNQQMHLDLRACWIDVGLDPNIYVAIVTGTGAAFCAGRDVKELSKNQSQGKRVPRNDPAHPLYNIRGFPDLVNLTKPVIAALNGFAVGGGLHFVLQCDLRVMAEDAWLGDQHTNIGQLGSPEVLYQAMPRVTAAYMTLCNGRLSAQECLQSCIVNKVVPRAQLMDAATELAEMICQSSPVAVRAAKQLYNLSRQIDPRLEALQKSLDIACRESEDGAEGPRAFAEKRRAVWKNR